MDPDQDTAKTRLLASQFLNSSPSIHKQLPFRHSYCRWVALLIINLMVIGSFMTLEGPQPIETQMKEILHIDDEEYSLLYSVWALPSIVTPFLGGYLIDKFGIRPMLVLFSFFVAIGQIIYAYGGWILSFHLMLVGRAVYAIGTDPFNVAQIFLTNKWFQGKELGLAMSISGATFGLGRGFNSFLTPILYDVSGNIQVPMIFGAGMCIVGLFLASIMAAWDKQNEIREIKMDPKFLDSLGGEKANLSDCKHFKWIVWLLIINFAVIHSYALCFNALANDFYHIRYGFTNVEAGKIISLSFLSFAVSGILLGKVIDRYGKRSSILLYNSFLGILSFIYFLLVPDCYRCLSTIIPQVFLGAQQGNGEAAIYTSLPLLVEEKFLGTGFGLFFVFENLLIMIMPPVAAFIMTETKDDGDNGYFGMLLFFLACSVFVVIVGVMLFMEDRKKGKKLEKIESSTGDSAAEVTDSEAEIKG